MNRRDRRAAGHRGVPAAVFDVEQSMVLAQAVRSRCSECGSRHLHWGDVAGGMLTAPTGRQRGAFTEATIEGMGHDWPAWWCMDCIGVGIFTPQ